MISNKSSFVSLKVVDEHECYLTIEKAFSNQKGVEQVNYGYTRMIIAYEPSQG